MKVDGSNINDKSVATNKPKNLAEWLESRKEHIGAIIPEHTVNLERFMQSAKLAIYNPKTPNLAACSPDSIYRALKEAASYGLELSGVLGQAYLIPYNESFPVGNGRFEKRMTCHFQMGYKGLITLARRSKTIKTIACEMVYENDFFEVELACGRTIRHSLDLKKDRGEVIAYYCLVELENDGVQFAIMTKKDVEKHRDQFSKMYRKDDKENNWNKNFDAMALKTCCIKALKLCPISVEALEAVRREEINEIEDTAANLKQVNPEYATAEYEVYEEPPQEPELQKQIPHQTKKRTEQEEIDAAFDAQAEQYEAMQDNIPGDLF